MQCEMWAQYGLLRHASPIRCQLHAIGMKPHLHPSSGGSGSGSSLMRHAGPRALMRGPTRRPTDVARSRRSLSNVTPHASAKKGQASVTPGTPPVGSSSHDAPSTSGSLASTPTPPMGWLWQVGKTPTAAATVADLKQDRIKPKKWVHGTKRHA